MGFLLKEHVKGKLVCVDHDEYVDNFDKEKRILTLSKSSFEKFKDLKSKLFRPDYYCYIISNKEHEIEIEADYFIGVDWLLPEVRYVYVEPKINRTTKVYFENQLELGEEETSEVKKLDDASENAITEAVSYSEIDYLKMLLDVMADEIVAKECADLVRIDWEQSRIKINQQHRDQLTPFLVVQFLQLLKQIVRKGLKKSYYKVQENLSNRIKGKILVGQQIKQNIFKNQFTKTYCEYQVFGIDNQENRFLKEVFRFATSYIDNNAKVFTGNNKSIKGIINYCRPALQQIGSDLEEEQLKHFKHNPFFKEYKEAVQVGQYLLKRFAFNITKTIDQNLETPPFWIDMPRLFELYVYQKLLKANNRDTTKIKYQFSTYGNALDILIKDSDYPMVIDAKYKLHYKNTQVHADMRQVAGYARLNKVLNDLQRNNETFDKDFIVPCLIIYPDVNEGLDLLDEHLDGFKIENLIVQERSIKAYHKIYKLGVKLPLN